MLARVLFLFCVLLMLAGPARAGAGVESPPIPGASPTPTRAAPSPSPSVVPEASPAPSVRPLSPEESGEKPWEVGTSYAYETLTKGLAPWREYSITAAKTLAKNTTLYGRARETSRFSLDDTEFAVGGYQPLSKKVEFDGEFTYSGTHRVLPEYGVSAGVRNDFGAGWGVRIGFDHRYYTGTGVNIETASVERYFGNWRAGGTVYFSQVQNLGSAVSFSGGTNYYYDDEGSSAGIILSTGHELVSVGFGRILITKVQGVALYGSHWFTPRVGMTWDLGLFDQAPLYSRRRIQLGIKARL